MDTDRRTPARRGALALATLLAGCHAVGPDFRRPEAAPPPAWHAAAATEPADLASRPVPRPYDGRRWWSVFRDPVLDGLVAEALRQNLDLQAAALRIEEARAQRTAAGAQGKPSVSGSGIAGRQRSSENGLVSSLAGGTQGGTPTGTATPPPSPYSDLFQAGFDATWELDLWGKARRGVEAADANIESAEQARGSAAISLGAELARTYLQLRGAQRQLAIVQADVDDQRRLAALADARSRHGFAARADAVQQQAEVSRAEAELPPIAQDIARARNQLALLLALPPGALDERLGAVPPGEVPLPPEVPVGLPGELLQRRPDVMQREADLHAATAKVGQAQAQRFPSITLGGAAGLQATHAGDLAEWASRFWVGGLQLSLPIFEGGKLQAQVQSASAQMQEAALAYRGTVLAAYHDADNALEAYAQEQRHAAALARQLEDARRSRDLMASRWRGGFVSQMEVIDAGRRVHQAELAALQSRVAASTDLVALYKALGGDWDGAEHATSAEVADAPPTR
jgi:NodT family efflux transporter outer membrane factor (OMF) lipoprotein